MTLEATAEAAGGSALLLFGCCALATVKSEVAIKKSAAHVATPPAEIRLQLSKSPG